jgi:hypothetical protein
LENELFKDFIFLGCDYKGSDNSIDCKDKVIDLSTCYDSILDLSNDAEHMNRTPVKIGLYDIHVVSERSELYIDAFVAYDAANLLIGNNFLLILGVNDHTKCTVVRGMKVDPPTTSGHKGRRMQGQEEFQNHKTGFGHDQSGLYSLNKFQGDYSYQDEAKAKKSLPIYSLRKIRHYSFSDMRGLLFVVMNRLGLSDHSETQI